MTEIIVLGVVIVIWVFIGYLIIDDLENINLNK